ncbi:hypothetical protein [Kutzneria kofuensis]|uniref:MmyB family transcriptional regulator n=1 Tax=Kutzneria kofuensis TaxID=103725 RepID=UPI003CD07837
MLHANKSARALWTDWPALPPAERNILWWTFADPRGADRARGVGGGGAGQLARFRAGAARHPEDPGVRGVARTASLVQQGGSGLVAAPRRRPAHVRAEDPAPPGAGPARSRAAGAAGRRRPGAEARHVPGRAGGRRPDQRCPGAGRTPRHRRRTTGPYVTRTADQMILSGAPP